MDNRAVALVLVVGILASMATFAFYMNLSDTELPAAPAPAQATGFVAVEIVDEAPAVGAPANGGSNNGATP